MSNFFLRKFGRAGDIDAINWDIYDVSTGSYEFPTVAFQTVCIAGSNDVVGSNGVHSIVIEGLNAAGAEITEVATLTGATAKTLANSYYRVNRAYIKKTGATLTNSWNIDIKHTGSATLARISANAGQTLQAIYTMPAGVSGHVKHWYGELNRETTQVIVQGTIRFQTRNVGEGWRTQDAGAAGSTIGIDRRFDNSVFTIKPLTDIRLRVTAINTNNVAAYAGFEIEGHRDVR